MYIKSAVCMSNNGKDTKHIRQIYRRVHLVRNGEKWKMHKLDWCEGGVKLAEIATKNVDDPNLTPKMKYIMVRLEKWDKKLVQRGDRIQDSLWNTSSIWLD